MNCPIRVGTQEFALLSVDELPERPSAAQEKEKHNQKIVPPAYYEQRKPQNVFKLATRVRERRAAKPRDSRNEGGSPRRKKDTLFFRAFPSRAFSHARVYSRAFCSTD